MIRNIMQVIIAIATIGFIGSELHADIISPDRYEYAVYAQGSVSMNGRAVVNGHLGADGSLSLGDDAQVHSGGVYANGSMTLRYRTSISGPVLCGGALVVHDDSMLLDSVQSGGAMVLRYRVEVHGDATSRASITSMSGVNVQGSTSQYSPLPHGWATPDKAPASFNPGATDVVINQRQSAEVSPGAYDDLTMRSGSTILMSSGVYHFDTLYAESDVQFQIDDSSGPVQIYVRGNMTIGYRAQVLLDSGAGDNLEWFIRGNLLVRTDSDFVGHIQAQGNVTLQDRVSTSGSIYTSAGFSSGWDCELSIARSSVYYVATNGNDTNSGTSMAAPLRTVQAAINKCTDDGSTIYIAPGVYPEQLQVGVGVGSSVASGTRESPIRVIGDVNGTFTNSSPGAVRIEGAGRRQRGIQLRDVDCWEFDGVSLFGFTQYGIYGTNCGLTFQNATIEVPSSYGIYMTSNADVSVRSVRFDRTTTSGHVAWIQPAGSGAPVNLDFSNNDMALRGDQYLSHGFGSGFQNSGRSWYARYSYGLIAYGDSRRAWGTITICNNVMSDLYLPLYCYVYRSSGDVYVSNNTICGCLYSIYSYSISHSGDYFVDNNIIAHCYYGVLAYFNRSSVISVLGLLEHEITYNMSSFGRPFELDVITGDPQFREPEAGNFSLSDQSPGVDAGTMRSAPRSDIAGYPRPRDGDGDGIAQVDFGAFEQVYEGELQRVRVVRWREIGSEANR